MTLWAKSTAFFPFVWIIFTTPVHLSLMVIIAPLWSFPMIVSISKSPNLARSSTMAGRSEIGVLSLIIPRLSLLAPRFRYRLPCVRR